MSDSVETQMIMEENSEEIIANTQVAVDDAEAPALAETQLPEENSEEMIDNTQIEEAIDENTQAEEAPEDEEGTPALAESEDLIGPSQDNVEKIEEENIKLHRLPLGRIKNIMKMDPDVNMASQEAVYLITKSVELFVESLAIESFSHTKKKTITKVDVDKAIDAVEALAFLDGAMED